MSRAEDHPGLGLSLAAIHVCGQASVIRLGLGLGVEKVLLYRSPADGSWRAAVTANMPAGLSIDDQLVRHVSGLVAQSDFDGDRSRSIDSDGDPQIVADRREVVRVLEYTGELHAEPRVMRAMRRAAYMVERFAPQIRNLVAGLLWRRLLIGADVDELLGCNLDTGRADLRGADRRVIGCGIGRGLVEPRGSHVH